MVERLSDEQYQADRQAEYELCQRVVAGDPEAGAEFIHRYQGLIKHEVGRIGVRASDSHVIDNDDLFQEGMLYFLESARRYSPNDEGKFRAKFSYFATKYLGPRLMEIREGRHQVRLNDRMAGYLRAVDAENWHRMSHRRPIMSTQEMADFLGILPDATPGSAGWHQISVGDVQRAQLLTKYIGSLDRGWSPATDSSPGNAYTLEDISPLKPLNSAEIENPEDQAEISDTKQQVDAMLSELSEEESFIIRARYGFDDGEPKLLEEIAELYNQHYQPDFPVTRERIRQSVRKIEAKLRQSDAAKSLLLAG